MHHNLPETVLPKNLSHSLQNRASSDTIIRADEAETEEQHTVEMQLEKTKSAKNKKIKDVIWNVAKVSAGIAILGMGANSVFRKRK